jgi:hypothetical protein
MTKPSFADYGTYDESACPELWDGVVGYWAPCLGPSGTRLHDVSRYNNWGTLTNMDAATDWVVDGGQYALDFDGSNDQVATLGKLPTTASRTVTQWVYGRSSATQYCFGAGLTQYTQGWFFGLENGGQLTITQFGLAIKESAAFPLNAWQFIGASHNGNAWTLYRNGVSVNTGTMTTSPTAHPIFIGSYGGGGYWNGLVDESVVWNRQLTPNEVRTLYNLGRGGMLERKRRRRYYSVQADAVRSYLFVNRGQVIGGGTL